MVVFMAEIDEKAQVVRIGGELAVKMRKLNQKTGIPARSLVRVAVLEWFQRHDGEPGVEQIKF